MFLLNQTKFPKCGLYLYLLLMFESDNWEDFPLREGDYVTGHSLNNENDDDNQCVTGSFLLLILFSTTLALFISLPISPTNDSTLGGKFSGFIENLLERKKRRVKQESDWKRQYGSCDELKEDVKLLGTHMFKRRFFLYKKLKVRQTLLRLRGVVQEQCGSQSPWRTGLPFITIPTS